MIDRKLVACAVASIVGHVVLGGLLDTLPPREAIVASRPIEIRIVMAPPSPPIPEPPKPEPTPAVATPARARPVQPTMPRPAVAAPKPDAPVVAATEAPAVTAKPVFGFSMESTSQGGSTAVSIGNTPTPQPPGRPASIGGGNGPLGIAAAHEVTKLPMPRGRCAGKYTDAARAAAIEGVVVLDLVVDASGRARDIQVVEGLGHGLTEAAIAALRGCTFTPGEREGASVAVKIRGFKIRFLLHDGS